MNGLFFAYLNGHAVMKESNSNLGKESVWPDLFVRYNL